MKIVILSLVAFLNAVVLHAQSAETIYLWPGDVPGESMPKSDPVQTPDTSRSVHRITDVTNPLLEVFTPENSNGKSIIVAPGGGYQILAINLEGYEIAAWLSGIGYTVYVLQYRVPQKQAGALMDMQRAIRMVRMLQGNDAPVGVMGFSAGGSLAARASILFEKGTYVKTDEIDALSARPDFAILIYPAYLDQGPDRTLTPELDVEADIPPMFLFETADDPYGNSALVMAGALRDRNIPVELHFLPTGGHGYGLRKGNPAAETWPGLLEAWLGRLNN